MVTGIKTASNITITTTEEVQHGEEASLGVDVPAIQTAIGPKGSNKSKRYAKHSQTIPGPIVFAIQVEKLRLTSTGDIEHEKVIGGTLGQKSGGSDDYVVVQAGNGLEDEEVGDFGVAVEQGVDDEEGGDACEFVVPSGG